MASLCPAGQGGPGRPGLAGAGLAGGGRGRSWPRLAGLAGPGWARLAWLAISLFPFFPISSKPKLSGDVYRQCQPSILHHPSLFNSC